MSCVNGIHDRLESSGVAPTPAAMASMFVITLRCVSTTLRFARRAGGILHERDIVGRGGVVHCGS
jgi:hypothetical protein